MRTKDCIFRCLHIIRKLLHGQKIPFLENQRNLNELSSLTGEDCTITNRAFQRDLGAIRELFLIDTRYARIEMMYSIKDKFPDEILRE